jgi:hypothetical protein
MLELVGFHGGLCRRYSLECQSCPYVDDREAGREVRLASSLTEHVRGGTLTPILFQQVSRHRDNPDDRERLCRPRGCIRVPYFFSS